MKRLFFCSILLLVYLIFSLILGCSDSKDNVGPENFAQEPINLANPQNPGGNLLDSIIIDTVYNDTIVWDTIVLDSFPSDTIIWDTISYDTIIMDT